MDIWRTTVVAALAGVAVAGGAYPGARIARVALEEGQATRAVTTETPAATASAESTGEAVASPGAGQTGEPGPIVTPSPTQQATSFEEDCMASCHIPDLNDSLGAGAKPLPASHAERTTCLECHTSALAPVLPDTHIGRLDESCRGCHLEE